MLAAPAALPLAAARAYPEGAPWDALDHPQEGCASCHFGDAPVQDSAALAVAGLDRELRAGETYPVTVRFTPEDARIAGFLARFEVRGAPAGAVLSQEEGAEVKGSAVRVIAQPPRGEGTAVWTFDWQTPGEPGLVELHLGALEGNDDASPFGDRVHLKTLSLEIAR